MTQRPQLLHDEHLDNDDNDVIHDDHLDNDDNDIIHDEHKDSDDNDIVHDEHLDSDDTDIIHDDHLDNDIDMIHDEHQPTLSSLLLQRDERERLGIPLCSAQVLTVGSSGTTATVLDLSEHP